MKTLHNIEKIIKDLEEKERNKNDFYTNVSNRLDKVLENYIRDLDSNYNTIINKGDLSHVIKELIR